MNLHFCIQRYHTPAWRRLVLKHFHASSRLFQNKLRDITWTLPSLCPDTIRKEMGNSPRSCQLCPQRWYMCRPRERFLHGIVQPRIKGMDQRKLQEMNEGCLLQSLMNDKIAGDYNYTCTGAISQVQGEYLEQVCPYSNVVHVNKLIWVLILYKLLSSLSPWEPCLLNTTWSPSTG